MLRQLTSLALAASMVGGCAMARTERTVIEYDGKTIKPLEKVPFKGEFVLYESPKETAMTPVYHTNLEEPAKIGFKRSTTGPTVAVAGDQTVAIAEGSYVWRGTPAAGQVNGVRTAAVIGTVALVVVAVVVVGSAVAAVASLAGGI